MWRVEVREQEWLDYRKDNPGKRVEYQAISQMQRKALSSNKN